MDEGFRNYVLAAGGGDGFLFLGPKVTQEITCRVDFGKNWYGHTLQATASGLLIISTETMGYGASSVKVTGLIESQMKTRRNEKSLQNPNWLGSGHYVYESVSSWTVYHFHDTSDLAPVRRDQSLRDSERLRHDASNIAAFLLELRENYEGCYALIRDTVRLIAPFFDDFLLRPRTKGKKEQVRLEWQQKGCDFPFQPNQLSDGTVRFICLATVLLQPDPPATIVVDEPELGLHPYAISVLADLVKSASERTQVIISTQSPTLLDYFEPHEIVVVSRQHGRSTFERLYEDRLASWLEDYSVGELWRKNIVRGGPSNE